MANLIEIIKDTFASSEWEEMTKKLTRKNSVYRLVLNKNTGQYELHRRCKLCKVYKIVEIDYYKDYSKCKDCHQKLVQQTISRKKEA